MAEQCDAPWRSAVCWAMCVYTCVCGVRVEGEVACSKVACSKAACGKVACGKVACCKVA